MAFADFAFPQVGLDLGLSIQEADLFSAVAALPLREEFLAALAEGADVALAINTEKAKSEFIIAPLLLELRRMMGGAIGLFSGVELEGDPDKGLNGICDFILTKEPHQFFLRAPLVAIVEAKNDNLRNGLGQVIAATYAAELYNQRAGRPLPTVFGVVTTGSAWKFLRLDQSVLSLDVKEYYIDNAGKILGVLKHILETA